MLVDYKNKQSATLKKNPNYWQKGLPYLDGVEFVYNYAAQSQALQLQAGAVDIQAQTAFQGLQALFADPGLNVITTHSTAIREVAMRVDKDPYSGKNARQAVAYCLDRQAIMQALYNGKGTQGNDQIFSPLYPSSPAFPDRNQDYAKAKQFGPATPGTPTAMKLTITTAGSYLDLAQYAQLIKAQCKPAGIDVGIDLVSATQFYWRRRRQDSLAPGGHDDSRVVAAARRRAVHPGHAHRILGLELVPLGQCRVRRIR